MINGDLHVVETDFLVVGVGPAGSSMAAFLGQNGKPEKLYTLCVYVTETGFRYEGTCDIQRSWHRRHAQGSFD